MQSSFGKVTTSITTTQLISISRATHAESSFEALEVQLCCAAAGSHAARHRHHPGDRRRHQRHREHRHTTSFHQFPPPRKAGRKAFAAKHYNFSLLASKIGCRKCSWPGSSRKAKTKVSNISSMRRKKTAMSQKMVIRVLTSDQRSKVQNCGSDFLTSTG